MKPIYSDDFCLGYIHAMDFCPPQTTVDDIKRHLCAVERIMNVPVQLFTAISNVAPSHDKEIIPIHDSNGPGSTASDPMALVVNSPDFPVRSLSKLSKLKKLFKPSEKKPAQSQYGKSF